MRRSTRKIISVLMVMLMVMSLTWQVFADESLPENQEAPDVQSENLQQESQKEEELNNGNEAAEVTAENEASEPAAEAPAASEADKPSDSETDAVQEAADKSEPVTGSTYAAPKAGKSDPVKGITIAGASVDGSKDSAGDGWTYEKESGRIVLRDYTGCADITSDGMGVDIVSTGYNRIGLLSCDGDINVTGTGVLLIDKVELAKDCSFNLHSLREYYGDGDDEGSVAVFVKQEDGSYMLVNGKVKGIIDEKVELPEDIRLVLPADSLLELQAFRVMTETDEDGNKTIIRDLSGYSEEELEGENAEKYAGHLLAGDISVNKGARIQNNTLDSLVASIIVAGNLINEGVISGGNVTVTKKNSGSGGLYSGAGSVEDSFVTLRAGQTMSINIKDSVLSLEDDDYKIENLNMAGKAELYNGGNSEIINIKGTSGSSLNIYSFDMTNKLKLSGEIEGAAVLIKSGITELAAGLVNGEAVKNESYGGTVFNYIHSDPESGNSAAKIVSDGTEGPVFLGPDDVTVPDPDSIPVVSFYLYQTTERSGNIELKENKEAGQKYAILDDYDLTKQNNNQITYPDLIETYFPNGLDFLVGDQSIIFEVFRCSKTGELSMTVLGEDYEPAVDPDGVFLIRLAYFDPDTTQIGGTTTTSTRASQTGSGNIGGNSKSIITGTGITRFSSTDPDPDPEPDPVKPDPDPKPNPDPDPKPDPVKPDPDKPSNEYTVAAVTALGDTLALQINEFDLNEGDENAEKAPYYNLSAYINGAQVTELSGPVEVVMDYMLPEEFRDKPLYAVFANEDKTSDETLMAVRAEYDEDAGTLTFETSQVGEFIIVALEFDGEEFSPEFYDELEKTEEAKLFIKHLKEKKENAGS